MNVIVVGAGVGGLTTGALLARAGHQVTVLEAHVYPGGCAGTFYHKKYRFDAGATLAGGFYDGGPMDIVAKATGIEAWPAHGDELAMVVQLPDGTVVPRWGDERRWRARKEAFGTDSLKFWQWQERTADALWDFALRLPPWPPQTRTETQKLAISTVGWLTDQFPRHLNPAFGLDALTTAGRHIPANNHRLRQFVDGQLLIAAQTTSRYTNALYGASALDLPRRGVVHFEKGIGGIAETLAEAVRRNGGTVHYKQEVNKVVFEQNRPVAVETKRRKSFPCDLLVLNLPPWNIKPLLGEHAPAKIRNLPPQPKHPWGAFMVYVGLAADVVPDDFPLHHQVIAAEPMGETNTVFLSLSPAWDNGRAPIGQRSLTISTHTQLTPWWELFEHDRPTYEQRKAEYAEKMIEVASRALPNLREAAQLILPGTPVTFQRFTKRAWGWVGGFPQNSLFESWAPQLMPHVWMVGDSIFPGQSTAAVAMGGLRVANAVMRT